MLTNSLSSLTESKASRMLTKHGKTKQSKRISSSIKGPISNDLIIPFLYYLFPDSETKVRKVTLKNFFFVKHFSHIFFFLGKLLSKLLR